MLTGLISRIRIYVDGGGKHTRMCSSSVYDFITHKWTHEDKEVEPETIQINELGELGFPWGDDSNKFFYKKCNFFKKVLGFMYNLIYIESKGTKEDKMIGTKKVKKGDTIRIIRAASDNPSWASEGAVGEVIGLGHSGAHVKIHGAEGRYFPLDPEGVIFLGSEEFKVMRQPSTIPAAATIIAISLFIGLCFLFGAYWLAMELFEWGL